MTEIVAALLAGGAEPETSAEVVAFLESCEAVRYAPGGIEEGSEADAAEHVKRWIRTIERITR